MKAKKREMFNWNKGGLFRQPSINLSARHFFGGAKALAELQTEFHRKVGIPAGLDRGMEGSRATHQRVSQFYGNITRGEPDNIEFPKERLVVKKGLLRGLDRVEPDADFAVRVAESVQVQRAPVRDVALLAAQENRKRREAENTAAEYRRRAEPLMKPLQGLSAGQLEDVLKLANRYQQENEVERQERVAHARPRGRKGR
jgi:hypothetical protein